MTNSQFKADAFITLTNYGGIEIMLNRSCDGIYYRFNYGQDKIEDEEIFEAEIEHDYTVNEDDADSFFMHGDQAICLNEAMRIR
jgi:hypothetical protein